MKKKVVENVDSRSGVATLAGFKSLALILGIVLLASFWVYGASAQGYGVTPPPVGSNSGGANCDSLQLSERVPFACHGGVNYGNPAGTLTTCDDVRQSDGKNISGGTAGLDAGGSVCFSGYSQQHCASLNSHTYMCAGVSLVPQDGVDTEWIAFDIDEDEDQEIQREYYTFTTRDEERGRAGHTAPLFMNAHGICRKIDNTAGDINPLFMGVKFEDEWRGVHGVPPGGDPNGGYTHYANVPEISATMSVCCSPILVEICGEMIQTGYAEVGEVASAWGQTGGYAELHCAGNNDWRALNVIGVCHGGGGEGGGMGEEDRGRGYHGPEGGTISAGEWDSLSTSTQNNLKDMGYTDVGQNVNTNPQGAQHAAQAAEDDQQADAEQAEKTLEDNEDAILQAEEDAANDTDDSDDDDNDCSGVWC